MQLSSLARRDSQADLAGRLERARQLMDAAYDEPLNLDDVARVAFLSPHHFHRQFRRLVGETPHQYLTRRRIERARELLLTTELSVTQVCLAVGFSSLGSFSTLFRRFVGAPPTQFRARVVQSLGVPGPRPLLAPIPGCFARAFGALA